MRTAPVFSPDEAAIVYDAAVTGKKAPAIVLILADSGFHRHAASIYNSPAYRKALAELREVKAAKLIPATDPGSVRYGDLIIRREVRVVSAQAINGMMEQRPISLSAGVGWQVPA